MFITIVNLRHILTNYGIICQEFHRLFIYFCDKTRKNRTLFNNCFMKPFYYILAISLATMVLGSCHKADPFSPYTLKDIEGTWIWVTKDNEPIPNSEMCLEVISADGSETFWRVVDNRWEKTEDVVAVKHGIYEFAHSWNKYKIVNVDLFHFIVDDLQDNTRYSGEKVMTTDSKHLQGTWICDDFKTGSTTSLKNYEITIDDSSYMQSYDGAEPIIGRYWLCNNFMFYQSNRAGSMYVTVEMGGLGPIMKQSFINADGSRTENILQRKAAEAYTLDDVVGIWHTTVKNGEPIPLQESTICVAPDNSGHSVIHGIIDGRWVGRDVSLSIQNNVLTRVIDGVQDVATIVYIDSETIIWIDHASGDIITRKKIVNPDEHKGKIQGFWETDKPFVNENGETVIEAKSRITQDSIICKDILDGGMVSRYKGAYSLYGDVIVIQADDYCLVSRISFGYDTQKKQLYRVMHNLNFEGAEIPITYYKVDLEARLAGFWICVQQNGEWLPTKKVYVDCFFPKSGMNGYYDFTEGYRYKEVPYSLEGRRILYHHDPVQYEDIISLNDSIRVCRGSSGDENTYFRIPANNPLTESIVGEWYCERFQEEDQLFKKVTYVFDASGLVTFKQDGATDGYGTYRLFGSLLVMRASNNGVEETYLWIIGGNRIENNTMTWGRDIEGRETPITNVLTKVN